MCAELCARMEIMMQKTKIICTLGPATDRPGILEELVKGGMNVARMNFSHGTYEEHDRRIQQVNDLAQKYKVPIAILLDTKGPEIRTGELEEDKVFLEAGKTFTLSSDVFKGNAARVSISYPDLYQDIVVGEEILLDDGLISLK